MINTVIFDLDGLLIDSEKISYAMYSDLVGEYGYEFSLDDYAREYSGHTGVGNMDHLIESFHLPFDTEEGLRQMKAREKTYLEQGVDLKEGARQLLEYLRQNGYSIVLATSSTRDRAVGILKSHGIDTYFDGMVFGAEIERGKPYPDIFIKACEKMGKQPQECLVLEDSEAGVQAAFAAHVPVICIPDMKPPAKEYADMAAEVFGSLADVIGYLGG